MNIYKRSENTTVDGFDFDRNTFEDLVDNFTPMDEMLNILDVDFKQMDKFCWKVFGKNFKDAYYNCHARAMMYDRKAFNTLAKNGNQTAIKIVAEYFMNLGQNIAGNNGITFVCNVPDTPSDVDSLQFDSKEDD